MKNILPLIQSGTGSINNVLDIFNPMRKIKGLIQGSEGSSTTFDHKTGEITREKTWSKPRD